MVNKLTYDYVKTQFEKHKCKLLETEYINSKTKMKYRCQNNHISSITYSDFKHGYRCAKCSRTEKHTFENVKNYFTEQGCRLLETEYVNSNTKMKYRCSCGNESEITYGGFQQGHRCVKCGGTEKHTFENVKKYFKEQGCKLLETEYVDNRTIMKYKCSCTNDSYITFSNFKQGKRCMKCSGNEKLTYEFVYNYFKEQGCKLLEQQYINAHTNMNYICKCGNESSIRWSNFQQNKRCMKCSGNEKLTYEFVYNYFKEHDCELLETEYINSSTKMKYLCKCKKESLIVWDDFFQGKTCVECGYDKQEKSSNTFKEYIFPSGDIRKIQGFEHIALDELVKQFKEEDIITQRREMPKITYNFENKQRRYYPDIWIKSINKIIEVKSDFIYEKELIKNKHKALATKNLGYDFEFWIYSKKIIKTIV